MSSSLKNISQSKIAQLRCAMQDTGPGANIVVRAILTNGRTYYAPYLGLHRVGGISTRGGAIDHANQLQARLDVLRGQRERACLRCNALFPSEGHHNRMCDRCRANSRDHALI